MDSISYAAQLTSNRHAIDGFLDGRREVTASHKAADTLSAEEQKKLKTVYLAVENHLLTGDTLRIYTKLCAVTWSNASALIKKAG